MHLNLQSSVDLDRLSTAEGCISSARSADTVLALEELTAGWCAQIEQVLAEGNQMRKEADDTGPLAELEYWKQRTAKFSCLVDQVKSQPCRGVITTLVAAKSRSIKVEGFIPPTTSSNALTPFSLSDVEGAGL